MPDQLKDDEAIETIAPVIQRDSATGHSGLVVDCPPHALPFGVIFEEYAARRGGDFKQHASEVLGVEPDVALSELRRRLLHKMNGSALCLSGGGIRSASFGLGVLEGLARFSEGLLSPAQGAKREPHREHAGLLHRLDYLSTVSGGGYIGSWLTAWIYRRRAAASPQPSSWESSYGEVVKALAGESNFTSGAPHRSRFAIFASTPPIWRQPWD